MLPSTAVSISGAFRNAIGAAGWNDQNSDVHNKPRANRLPVR